jgi:hypothetical protein
MHALPRHPPPLGGGWDILRWSKSIDCRIIRRVKWQRSCWCSVFSLVGGSSAVMKVFPHPLLFSLLCISFHIEPLKIQMCPIVCICFKVGPHFYDCYLFWFKASWIFFVLISSNCILFHNFYIQFSHYFFIVIFLSFALIFFISSFII